MEEPWPHQKVRCPDCQWIGERCEAYFDSGHIMCPECGWEPLRSMQGIPNYGTHMTLKAFVNCVLNGLFIDYDGHGYYATKTEMSNEGVIPSDITGGNINQSYTHVVWFNK